MIGKELRELLSIEKLKGKDLSQILEIPQSTLSNYLNNVSSPDIKMLRLIKKKYLKAKNKNINLDWLITGKGEMFISAENKDDLDEKIEQKIKEALSKHGL